MCILCMLDQLSLHKHVCNDTCVCCAVQQRQEELLSLWQTALSAEAAQKLDMKRYLTASLVGFVSLC